MIRSVFKSGNSLVVALPGTFLDNLQIHEGSEVHVTLNDRGDSIEISPVEKLVISPDFAQKVDTFIETYRPALEALSQR